jgi:hypothetical protein
MRRCAARRSGVERCIERCRRGAAQRGARCREVCRAVPLCREVLRLPGCRMVPGCSAALRGAARVEMRKRGPSIGSSASTVDVRGCRVQGGPIVSIAHGIGKRSHVCVDTESFGQAAQCALSVREQRRRERADAGRIISRHAPGELGDWMHLCVSWSRRCYARAASRTLEPRNKRADAGVRPMGSLTRGGVFVPA